MSTRRSLKSRKDRIAALGYDYAAQPKQLRSRCNLCGFDRFVTLAHGDRYGYPARADGCLRCGLVFLNPVMTPDAYTRFYLDVYRPLVSAYHGRLIDARTIQAEQRDYAAALADLLAPRLEKWGGKSLLDVGGSTGVVAHHLKHTLRSRGHGARPCAAGDRGGAAARIADGDRLRRGLRLRRHDLRPDPTVPGGRSPAGRVALAAQDPGAALPDGLFFVDIVDFRAAYRRNGSVEGAIKIDHPFYLTGDTMQAYLRRSGFDILAIDYAADHLHVGYVCAPGESEPDFLTSPESVDAQWREIRAIQNPLPPTDSSL